FMDRDEIASRWFAEEYRPVVRMLRSADMIGARTEAEAYMRVAAERYRLIRTHEWNDEIIERLRRKVR
ncbi:MAG TPA: chromosome partitioning protein ParB, partial [Streptosporangiaceae bacterium]|nr:chromosome partitioning protein ParB [Streptosporangiaceae bacterium]